MDNINKKNRFRQKALNRLKKKKVNNYKLDKLLINQIIKEINSSGAKDIMVFIPLKLEPNIMPLIKLLREKGYNLYVPFMQGETFKLVRYRLPLKRKKFNIKEPNNSYFKIRKIDLAIVPLIGVDKSLKRVGFGKGMYDRFYEKFGENIKKTLFINRELQYINDVITDTYDIKADKIIATSIKEIKI